MEKIMYQDIAAKLGLSCATVSKSVRHCSGVDSDTRQLVLDELEAMNVRPTGKCDIYCILPDLPKYFWGGLRRGICQNVSGGIRMKLNIFTRTIDEKAVLSYLREAEEMNPSAIIISAHITDAIAEKLKSLTPRRLIVFLSEPAELMNTFYIGADPYRDGYMMGEYLVKNTDCRRPVILTSMRTQNTMMRQKGFMKALDDLGFAGKCTVQPIYENRRHDLKVSSYFASLLAPHAKKSDCVYSPFGNAALPLAVKKAGFDPSVLILAHDTFSSADPTLPADDFSAVVNQDVYSQGKAAIAAAEHFVRTRNYPKSKFTFIPSVVRQNIT